MDLTKQYPRSPYVKVGGYVMLARVIDKARSKHANTLGEYVYNSLLDKILFRFLQIDADEFLAAIKTRSTDDEVVEWVQAQQTPRSEAEINEFNEMLSSLGPKEYDEGQVPYLEREEYEFKKLIRKYAPNRHRSLHSFSEFFEIARQRYGPSLNSWFNLIEADEGRFSE